MIGYAKRMESHLARYKERRLGVFQSGVWRTQGRAVVCGHILPPALRRLNILETVRTEFWDYFGRRTDELHRFFSHLNSSQAMCFNFFFPFFGPPTGRPAVVLAALGLPEPELTVSEWNFEVVLDPVEETHFDFLVQFDTGSRVVVEAKLTERGFGSAEVDARHQRKRAEVYLPRLRGRIAEDWLEPEPFFRNYQALRNICYADPETGDRVVFLLPRKNTALSKQTSAIHAALTCKTREHVSIVYLEDAVTAIRRAATDPLTAEHFALFQEKYCIE